MNSFLYNAPSPSGMTGSAIGIDQGWNQDQMALQNKYNQQSLDKQLAAQQAPLNWAKEKFGMIWPWLQGQFNSQHGPGTGQMPTAPGLPSSTIYTPEMQQQMINKSVAQTQGQAATNIQNMSQQLAGRGFGSNSPLAQALAGQQRAAAMSQTADTYRDLPRQIAEANAKQGLSVGGLANQQYGTQAGMYLGQLQNSTSQQNALLAALAGMI